MSLIDEFANSSLGKRFVSLVGGNGGGNGGDVPALGGNGSTPGEVAATPETTSTRMPGSARADAMAPMTQRAPAPNDGIPELTHPLRDPLMSAQPGAALNQRLAAGPGPNAVGAGIEARGNGLTVPDTPLPKAPPYVDPRGAFAQQPGAALAQATGQTGDWAGVMNRRAALAENGSLAGPDSSGGVPPEAAPGGAPSVRAGFNQQPGAALAEAAARNTNVPMPGTPAGGPASATPAGLRAGSLEDAMRAASLRYDAPQPGEALAQRLASGPGPEAVGINGGGANGIPPGGNLPPQGGNGWLGRFNQGAGAQAGAALPKVPGAGMAGKVVGGALGMAGAVAKKAAPWIEPAHEALDVGKVALDPKSTKGDVLEQAAVGGTRIASTAAGAGIGAELGALTGPAAPIAVPVGGIIGGALGYWGGNKYIQGLRSLVGLPAGDPADRAGYEPVKLTKDAQKRVALLGAPKTLPDGTPIYDDPNQADQALLDKQAENWAAGKNNPALAKPASASAPQAAPATGAAPAPQQGGQATQLAALQAMQEQSPIAFTTIGGGQAPQVFYKDGSMATLQAGQAVPDEVAQFNDRHRAITNLMNGQPVPAQPSGQGGAQPGGLSPFQQTVYNSAVQKGVDPMHALVFTQLESANDPAAKNGQTSATGPLQLIGANRKAYNLPPTATDPNQEVDAGLNFVRDNTANLAKNLGRQPTMTEAYLGHVFGAKGGATLLQADPNAPVEQVIASFQPKDAAAIVKNNRIAGMTVGQARQFFDNKVQQAAAQLGGGQAPAAAAPAAGTPAAAGMALQQPVHFIRGDAQYMDMPTGGPAMQPVPMAVYNQGRQAGNVAAAANQYIASLAQGANYGANPTAGKLDEAAVHAAGQVGAAGVTAQGNVSGHSIAAKAEEYKADKSAASEKYKTDVAEQSGRYITAGGGVNPETMTPNPTQVFDKKGGQYVPANQKPIFAQPTSDDLALLKANAHDQRYVDSFVKHYGADRYQQFLKDGK